MKAQPSPDDHTVELKARKQSLYLRMERIAQQLMDEDRPRHVDLWTVLRLQHPVLSRDSEYKRGQENSPSPSVGCLLAYPACSLKTVL